MAEKEYINKWIQKAGEDYNYALSSLNEELEYFPQICWHFQQAAEKYLKSYIVANDLEFRKIHDLVALLKTCEEKSSDFKDLFDDCKFLQKFYIETRYPVVWESTWAREDALLAQEHAEKIKDFITSRL